MKILSILFFSFLTLESYSQSVSKVEFTSMSRGYNEEVSINSDGVIIKNRANSNPLIQKATSKKDWKNILKDIQSIDLDEVKNLESPTMKRAYDGARHSSITIIMEDGTEYQHLFDDEDPHEKLMSLMNCIQVIKK